ncbi:MAG TPA: hypothetical protein VFN35_14220 [Ktedonobacteraceae bacterium]|nr:hypothetical protein [Ktedonobacteraceae bacterium]
MAEVTSCQGETIGYEQRNRRRSLLLQLAQQFPHEFLQNPVLSLLFLTRPDFLTQLAPDAWLQLLDCPELPLAWREWLLQDGLARCQQYVGQLQTQASDSATFLPLLITHPHLVSKHMV